MKRTFSTAAVLSCTTHLLLCHIGEVYEILNFLTGDNLYTHQLPRAMRECEAPVKEQLPWTKSPILAAALARLEVDLGTITDREVRAAIVHAFIAEQCEAYGDAHELSPLNPGDHAVVNPVQELADMVGHERVVVVTSESEAL